ncbi:MAG TPA: hypothetical protein VFT59_04755, partial [Candidatus Saccharimonadales bacterium]|nr:hypothetical protein [Candidatus Saccharimonadales bacterium]
MLIAAIILALYFWAFFANVKSISSSILVSDTAAIMAGIAFLLSFVSYLWSPKKNISLGVISAYGL